MRRANVVLNRYDVGPPKRPTYIIGWLSVDGTPIGHTLEYPWRNAAQWQDGASRGFNFFHTSCVPAGVYHAKLNHKFHPLESNTIAWRLSLNYSSKLGAIEFHAGRTLIRNSEGCILCGRTIIRGRGIEPHIVPDNNEVMTRMVRALLGYVPRTESEVNQQEIDELDVIVRITVPPRF